MEIFDRVLLPSTSLQMWKKQRMLSGIKRNNKETDIVFFLKKNNNEKICIKI